MSSIKYTTSPETALADNREGIIQRMGTLSTATSGVARAYYHICPEDFTPAVTPVSREVGEYAAKLVAQPEIPASDTLAAQRQAVIEALEAGK